MAFINRVISIGALIAGACFLGAGTSWEIGLGAGLLTWAGLPTLE